MCSSIFMSGSLTKSSQVVRGSLSYQCCQVTGRGKQWSQIIQNSLEVLFLCLNMLSIFILAIYFSLERFTFLLRPGDGPSTYHVQQTQCGKMQRSLSASLVLQLSGKGAMMITDAVSHTRQQQTRECQ